MKILVIGSGGREHALCWKISQSPLCEKLICAPGNAGIEDVAQCVDIKSSDMVNFAKEQKIDLVVVGPEAPLVDGLADELMAAKIAAFGPSKAAAQLEGSKSFVKDLCKEFHIPTAAYEKFTDENQAKNYIQNQKMPIVIKADGLAAGKGVIIAQTKDQAIKAIDEIMVDQQFGDAGNQIVIEEFLTGEEASFFCFCDGENILALDACQDHKRAFDNDQGPNTGGMGTYSPTPVVDENVTQKIITKIIKPTIAAMQQKGMPFKGILFAGLMIENGEPKLIEFNVRFGDPECQVLMARMQSDLVPILKSVADGNLMDQKITWKNQSAVCVVMATKGYPGSYVKGSEIKNLENIKDAMVFHAGTKRDGNKILAHGGRVLGVTALGDTIQAAQKNAYKAVDQINWPQGFCRRDIAWRAIKKKDVA